MLLTIDVGNSNITLGLFSDAELRQSWRLETATRRTSDEYGLLVTQLLQQAGYEREDIDAVIIASVVPTITPHLESFSNAVLNQKAMLIGPGIKTGMPVRYDPPKDVGADRIVNGVAAYHRFKTACIVVDFGTATTFDSICSKGHYQGGAIAPGVRISMEALFQRAAKLPKVDFRRPQNVVGKSTVESMQSGAYFGYIALVDGIVGRMREEMADEEIHVIATGGLAAKLGSETTAIEFVDENLTLEGLRLIHNLNIS